MFVIVFILLTMFEPFRFVALNTRNEHQSVITSLGFGQVINYYFCFKRLISCLNLTFSLKKKKKNGTSVSFEKQIVIKKPIIFLKTF